MLTIKKFWDGHCALPVPTPSASAALRCTLSYTLFSPFRRLWFLASEGSIKPVIPTR